MSDIYVHHLTATIPDGDPSVDLTTAGGDYTLQRGTPSDDYAFAYVPSSQCGEPESTPNNGGVTVTWSDITSSITVTREGTSGEITVPIVIVEYLGAASGANEFIVRDHGTIAMAVSATGSSGTVSGVVDDADVVPFRTGIRSTATSSGLWYRNNVRLAWDSANDEVDATRGDDGSTVTVSYAVVEFVGSNYSVQSGTFTMSTAGSEQAGDTITSVGSVANAFTEVGHDRTGGIDDSGVEVYLSDATTISYFIESGAVTTGTVQYHVVRNDQMSVTWYTNEEMTSDPDNITLSPTVTTTEASLHGISARSAGTGSVNSRIVHTCELTSGSNVEVDRVDAAQTGHVSFAVVDWSSVTDAGGGGSALPLVNAGLVNTSRIGSPLVRT